MSHFPYLTVLTAAPLAGAAVVALLPKDKPELAKRVALGWSVLVFALGVGLWTQFDAGGDRFQLRDSWTWIPQWGAKFTFAVDGIALVMIALIALLVPLVILASWHDAEHSKRSVPAYFALLLALECTMIGVFAAQDVFLFYVFFEVMLVPMYFLIGSYGGSTKQYAAVKFSCTRDRRPVHARLRWSACGSSAGQTFDCRRWFGRSSRSTPTLAVPRLLRRLRDQGRRSSRSTRGCPTPAAPRRPGRRAARRRARQGRHVRHPAVLPAALPDGVEVLRLARAHAARCRLSSTRALVAVGQNDLKAAWCPYTSIAHFGFIGIGIFAFTTRRAPARCSTWSTTACAPACCSWSSACSWPAAARRWSATSAGPASCYRCWPASCSSPVWPRWRCPAPRRSSASSWC
jgi:NADH-quinone oxidoreductase subunit M